MRARAPFILVRTPLEGGATLLIHYTGVLQLEKKNWMEQMDDMFK